MNDYIGIIGLACLNEEFRTSLFAQGADVVATLHLTAPDLTAKEREWLDYLKNSSGAEREAALSAFATVDDAVSRAVCPQPPCGRYAPDGSRLPGNH